MISVKVKYRPPFLPVPISWNAKLPSSWDECNSRQLQALVYSQTPQANDINFLTMYTGLHRHTFAMLDKFSQYKLVEQCGQVANSPFNGAFCIKIIKCSNGTKLYAPGHRMRGVTFGQFIFIDAYFNDPEPASRAKFLSHLYLPRGEQFDEDRCLARAPLIKVSELCTEAILYNYRLFYEYFARAYPLLFQSQELSNSGTQKLRHSGTSSYDPRGWLKIYNNIVGADIINADRYAATPLTEMLRFLNDRRKDQLKNRKI